MAEQERTELIIVRRRASFDAAETKNSVWKIAYADFMTAMMAFFLVMWLISATNQETRESVASYFNPIKLADSTPDRKGIEDARRVDPGKAVEDDSRRPKPEPGQSTEQMQRPQAAQSRVGEAALFRDPYAALTEIAGGTPRTPDAGAPLDASRKEGWKGGEAFRDPFDPASWPSAPAAPSDTATRGGGPEAGSTDDDTSRDARAARATADKRDTSGDAEPAKGSASARASQDTAKAVGLFADDDAQSTPAANRSPAAAAMPPPTPVSAASSVAQSDRNGPTPAADKGGATAADRGLASAQADKTQPADKKPQSEAGKLQAAIAAALAPLGTQHPVADVRTSSEGLLISLTDDVNYGMFAVGSAEPTPGLVRTLDRITPLIARTEGQVIVRGHTDNLPFRSADYDNWRLSTARAHMAQYMLIRGGLDARRIERIEGFADRRPRNPGDPAAAENRRIELLVRPPQS